MRIRGSVKKHLNYFKHIYSIQIFTCFLQDRQDHVKGEWSCQLSFTVSLHVIYRLFTRYTFIYKLCKFSTSPVCFSSREQTLANRSKRVLVRNHSYEFDLHGNEHASKTHADQAHFHLNLGNGPLVAHTFVGSKHRQWKRYNDAIPRIQAAKINVVS